MRASVLVRAESIYHRIIKGRFLGQRLVRDIMIRNGAPRSGVYRLVVETSRVGPGKVIGSLYDLCRVYPYFVGNPILEKQFLACWLPKKFCRKHVKVSFIRVRRTT